MRIDVIVPVYEPTDKLKRVIQSLQRQTLKPEHIWLLHTEDGVDLSWTNNIDGQVPVREIMVKKADFDHGGTRDMGIRLSDADVVILLTQDAIPAGSDLFEKMTKPLAEERVAVSYARQIPGDECDMIERYTRMFNYPKVSRRKTMADIETLGIKTYFCSDVCSAYRKDVYIQLGGFEKKIIFNEDMVYAAKAIHNGYEIAYEAEAAVIHSHNHSNIQLLKRNFDLGVSQKCYPEIFENVKSEAEGIRLVKETAKYLLKKKRPFLIISLIIRSGCKYIGYRLGKNYEKLPKVFIRILTKNPKYWEKMG